MNSKNTPGMSDHIPVKGKQMEKIIENAIPKQNGITEITLSDGRVAKCRPAKGKDVMKAQRLMDGDAEKMLPALISVCTTIDGQMLTIEEQEEMPAGDFMKVMGHFGTAFQ